MAEKVPPRKRLRFRLAPNPSAGGGGGGGDGAAAPASAPRREPPSSPPRSPSPPKPFAYNPEAGSSGGGGGGAAAAPRPAPQPEPSSPRPSSPRPAPQLEPSSPRPSSPPSPGDDDDDNEEDYKGFKDEELELLERESGRGSLFMSDPQVLSMYSSDPQNPPRYICRQVCEPLSTQEFFSLRHNWEQLLNGKRTYLRPPKNNRVAKDNSDGRAFVTPKPPELALQCQEPLSDFVRAAAKDSIVQQKFKILSEHYVWIRQMRIDGSSFYRAFLFSYLENLGRMQGSQAEVTRLMECMTRFRKNFCHLHWDSAYFTNPGAFFSSVVSEFVHLVNSVASGLNADELYKRSLQETTSSRILCLLRLLTEVHIRTHHADYNYQQTEALKFCLESVRPFDAEADILQMGALSNALGIPMHLAYVDRKLKTRIPQVTCFDFFPQSESRVSTASGPLSSIRSYYLRGRDDRNSTMPAGNLLSSDHMPLVTLLSRTGQCDILYRK